jgi:hypothetical protein
MPFWARPKRHSFGLFLIFFFLRRKEKKKKKKGKRTTPFLAKGWLRPPLISPFFFSFLFFLKKKNQKWAKTTPFWAKRRSFGVNGIMGRFLQNGHK